MTPPKWAVNLARVVARDAGRVCAPAITWRQWHRDRTTSGSQLRNRIIITEGPHSTRDYTKHILLHELAHWLTQEIHTERFYAVAFSLYSRYMRGKVQMCIDYERQYKPRTSSAGYARYRSRRG